MKSVSRLSVLLVSLLAFVHHTDAFVTPLAPGVVTPSSSSRRFLVDGDDNNDNNKEPPGEELIGGSPSSSIDWDAEWKKVVKEQSLGKTTGARPGQNYYKSEAEIAAIQATNEAAKQVVRAQASIPTWESVKGDWKVRACVCVYVRIVVECTLVVYSRFLRGFFAGDVISAVPFCV
jgi:hypothetical protein